LAADAMARVEHGETDKRSAKKDVPRVEALEIIQDRQKDDYATNQALRSKFRVCLSFPSPPSNPPTSLYALTPHRFALVLGWLIGWLV
jgi:hypothetical protein